MLRSCSSNRPVTLTVCDTDRMDTEQCMAHCAGVATPGHLRQMVPHSAKALRVKELTQWKRGCVGRQLCRGSASHRFPCWNVCMSSGDDMH